ncbi:hypothetical protein JKF63_04189 [Porcisia hertigi]|uniref:Uncharacterized protein n=1 Tax=Porcisia hertigi TaxID=2761500 RepID=A0A836L821_9TRYP|nr:hypothetical protein JKF63_04189 [Porcisia hertigi]
MGSCNSKTTPHSGGVIDPVDAPVSTTRFLCCSTASDAAGKRSKRAQFTGLDQSTQHTRHEAGRKNALSPPHSTERAQQSDGKLHGKAAVQRADLRPPRRNPSGTSARSVHTEPHQPLRRPTGDHQGIPLDRGKGPKPGTRTQRRRQCWTDSPYTGQGSSYPGYASAGYFPPAFVEAGGCSHGGGGDPPLL